MDLSHFGQAIGRHRLVAALGFVAAVVLTFLFLIRLDLDGNGPALTYRQPQLWGSTVMLQVTQSGFPEGRSRVTAEPQVGVANTFVADPGRLTSLAQLYARLVDTNEVRRLMLRNGPIAGKDVIVREVLTADDDALPLIEIVGLGHTRASAQARVRQQATAFIRYIETEQNANAVPLDQRVQLDVVAGPLKPEIEEARSLALPVLIFLSLLFVVGAFVLALDNVVRHRAQRREESEGAATVPVALPDPDAQPEHLEESLAKRAVSGGRRRRTHGARHQADQR
jgi:hypothetical protein